MTFDFGRLPSVDSVASRRPAGTEGAAWHMSTDVHALLCGQSGIRIDLSTVADHDAAVLAVWADDVMRFDDEALGTLIAAATWDYWRASTGASDAAVDELAAAVADDAPLSPRGPNSVPTLDQARVELLIGANSERALVHLGELGREHAAVGSMCASRGLWIPESGSARRRFVSQPRSIMPGASPDPGLRNYPPPEDVLEDPRGLECPVPLTVMLEVELGLLPGQPLAASPLQRALLLTSRCEDCDAGEGLRDYRWRNGSSQGGRVVFDQAHETRCEGRDMRDVTGPDMAQALKLVPRASEMSGSLGRLGGWPRWRQSYPSWPDCCGRPMFFVLQTSSFDCYGAAYGFQCECGSGAQTTQTT